MYMPGQLLVATQYSGVWWEDEPISAPDSPKSGQLYKGDFVLVLAHRKISRTDPRIPTEFTLVLTQHGAVGWVYDSDVRLREP